jgi:hypothetical protein
MLPHQASPATWKSWNSEAKLDRIGATLQLSARFSVDVASDRLRIFGKTVYFGGAEAGRA